MIKHFLQISFFALASFLLSGCLKDLNESSFNNDGGNSGPGQSTPDVLVAEDGYGLWLEDYEFKVSNIGRAYFDCSIDYHLGLQFLEEGIAFADRSILNIIFSKVELESFDCNNFALFPFDFVPGNYELNDISNEDKGVKIYFRDRLGRNWESHLINQSANHFFHVSEFEELIEGDRRFTRMQGSFSLMVQLENGETGELNAEFNLKITD